MITSRATRNMRGRFVAVGLILILLGACSTTPPEPEDLGLAANREFFAAMLEQAEDYGASEGQIQALAHAAETGALTIVDFEHLFGPLFDCFDSIGGEGVFIGVITLAEGMTIPQYAVAFPEELDGSEVLFGSDEFETFTALVEECENRHLAFVWMAVQLQPTVVELKDAELLSRREEIRECVGKSGYAVDPDASIDELIDAIATARHETGVICYEFS